MFWHNLILSDRYRLARHLLFWPVRYLIWVAYLRLNYYTMNGISFTENLARTLYITGVGVVLDIILCCVTMYWLLPKYLIRKKYFAFGTMLLLLSIAHLALHAAYVHWYFEESSWNVYFSRIVHLTKPFMLNGTLAVCFLLVAYKLLKIGYKKEEERTELTVDNTNAELMLLKAQVHPHFLFNTLNNIYSYTLDHSALAGDLLGKLFHILRYMTKECGAPLVSLERELKMIDDYISLEGVRYGKRLRLDIKITGEPRGKMIAPLLLIPFVENSFKHGASKVLEHPWITITITITDERILFYVSNSKPGNVPSASKSGLGLKNVQRRLQLLYPGSHAIEIKSEAGVFTVNLDVGLSAKPEFSYEQDTASNEVIRKSPVYA